ncbi:MAG: hypothetical protein ACJ8LG_18635 [Massilia sp.]
MLGLFKRLGPQAGVDTSALGASALALPMPSARVVPAACTGVVVASSGSTRRVAEGARLVLAEGERAFCFHPGPYSAELAPFAAAPEIGLRVAFAVDRPDPRAIQQRFDLYLASEGGDGVGLAAFVAAVEAALQRELAQGNLELPPCTTLEEWNAFRAGFDQLLYSRFGVTVDDCVPVDLGECRDYAAMLEGRAAAAPVAAMAPPEAPHTALAFDPACADAAALRRLFLELPCVMCALRVAVLPAGQALFRQHQALLQRLDLVSLSVATMPALELEAPGQPLAPGQQLRRARHSSRAAVGLDEAWALLARLEHAGEAQLAALFDEADRIVANLEHDTAGRRAVAGETEGA